MPRVTDILGRDGLIEASPQSDRDAPVGDLTRDPLSFPAAAAICGCRTWRAPTKAFCWRSAIRRSAAMGVIIRLPARSGSARSRWNSWPEDVGFAVPLGSITLTECQMVNQFKGSATEAPCFTRGYGLAFGQSERKTMSMALVDRALRARELGEEVMAPAQDEEFVMSHSDNVQATGFVEHLKLPHYVDFQSELGLLRKLRKEFSEAVAESSLPRNAGGRGMNAPVYNFAYLDEQTKRMIRRAILKAIAIPGYQVPFASREMPMPYGWGTGGVQVTAAILGPDDVLKVIDQGSDDTTNAISIRKFFCQDRRRRDHHPHGGCHRDPDPAPGAGSAAACRPSAGLSGADPGTLTLSRAARDRDPPHACARRIRADACQTL